jgi:hypothetical protein
MARKRSFSTFSLSFLDIMSCGFGAVALIFLIIKHDANNTIEQRNNELMAEVNLLEEDVRIGEKGLVKLRNTLSELDQQLAEAKGRATRITTDIESINASLTELQSQSVDSVSELQQQVTQLKKQYDITKEKTERDGNNVRQHTGQGNRQYLTGMKMGGSNILILLDASASMLDERLVNIIRRRNMNTQDKISSPKWQRALATVEWLTARFPQNSDYQLYTFNTDVIPAIKDSENRWLAASDSKQLNTAVANLRRIAPADGTNLEKVFASISKLSPKPDNVFLITDGLPTQGSRMSKKTSVTEEERLKLFHRAMDVLPSNISVNVILAPMEGDPLAAAAFWQLAQRNKGSLISPSEDWP